ncbi:MAG: alpha/beta fold hydrolase [Phycisphaerales bacterium]|nr:alpha/beta fold hydrolase [Phycisphaerales bacterium]
MSIVRRVASPLSHSLRRVLLCGILALTGSTVESAQSGAKPAPSPVPAINTMPAPDATGAARFAGEISIQGIKLGFTLVLTRATGATPASATIAIPMQGLKETPLEDVSNDGLTWRFTLKPPQAPEAAHAKFEVKLADDQASGKGTLNQNAQTFPVTLRRLMAGESADLKRPQTPVAPFPYESREINFVNPADGAEFAGTLTLPARGSDAKATFPAVVLITGSGTQDRDETILGHKPFLIIADHLTRAGIAVFRVDDRGFGGLKDPKNGTGDTRAFASDISSAMDALLKQPEIDATRVGLIGHSEGGLIAPLVAKQRKDVAFIVLLAGPGVPGDEILREQMLAILRAQGTPQPLIERISTAQVAALAAAKTDDPAKLREAAEQLVIAQTMPNAPPDAKPEPALIDDAIKAVTEPWMKTFITLDPREALAQVTCPVLALNGALDVQVLHAQNIPEITRALGRGKCTDYTAIVLPGLNHLFQPAKTGSPSEYVAIDTTFDPKALAIITQWITERTKTTARP